MILKPIIYWSLFLTILYGGAYIQHLVDIRTVWWGLPSICLWVLSWVFLAMGSIYALIDYYLWRRNK